MYVRIHLCCSYLQQKLKEREGFEFVLENVSRLNLKKYSFISSDLKKRSCKYVT